MGLARNCSQDLWLNKWCRNLLYLNFWLFPSSSSGKGKCYRENGGKDWKLTRAQKKGLTAPETATFSKVGHFPTVSAYNCVSVKPMYCSAFSVFHVFIYMILHILYYINHVRSALDTRFSPNSVCQNFSWISNPNQKVRK
jgi:hypothetical protein